MTTRRRARAIYRRRRLAVFGGLIVLIAALAIGAWLVIAQPWANADAPPVASSTETPAPSSTGTPSPDESPASDPSAEPSAEPSTDPSTEPSTDPSAEPSPDPSTDPSAEATPGVGPCHAQDVNVEAVADADTYAAGEMPAFSILLTNQSSADCTIDVGTATQIFTVTSGNDTWWDSRHCQENPASQVMTLAAGQSVSSAQPVVWDRTRSAATTCADENRPRAPGGGASYHLAVSIGGFTSTMTKQILLY